MPRKKRPPPSEEDSSKRGRNTTPPPPTQQWMHVHLIPPQHMLMHGGGGGGGKGGGGTLEEDHSFSREEKAFLSTQTARKREKLIRSFKVMTKKEEIPLRFRVIESNLPDHVKMDILTKTEGGDVSPKYQAWIEGALQLPFGVFSPSPVSTPSQIRAWLHEARALLDSEIWGQEKAKDETVRMLCQWASSGGSGSFALGLHGEPGIGKTSFVMRALSKVFERPFTCFGLGGLQDSSYLLGHSYCYEGSQCGQIASSLMRNKVMDGVYLFDEVDKVSKSPRGDEIGNTLIHLTDKEQNHVFKDKYFAGVNIDMSKALMVFSYNDESMVSPILLDRLTKIRFDMPTPKDKEKIAERHLIPKALLESGLSDEVTFSPDAISALIDSTSETGVRHLDRAIRTVVNTINCCVHGCSSELHSISVEDMCLPLRIEEGHVRDMLLDAREKESKPELMMYL